MSLLDDLAVKYGTDKGIWGYLPHYTRELEAKRQTARAVLEIGICGQRDIPNNVTGASLWMWHDYFPNAQIVGIDIDYKWMVNTGRIRSFVGDQGRPDQLTDIASKAQRNNGQPFALYDLIVDDAVHDPPIQLTALRALLPFLAPDGLYAIEDVCPYKLPDNDIRHMTDLIPPGFTCEVISTHKDERLLFVKHAP